MSDCRPRVREGEVRATEDQCSFLIFLAVRFSPRTGLLRNHRGGDPTSNNVEIAGGSGEFLLGVGCYLIQGEQRRLKEGLS